MTPFRFHRDPLFLTGCAAYAVNRLTLKPHLPNPFLHGHFNDLWLIPCALPLLLWLHRWLGWRDDRPPTFIEVTSHLLLWSVLFEVLGPRLMPHATGDARDIACYWLGGLVAWAWWNRAALIGGHGAEPRMNTDPHGSPTMSLSSGGEGWVRANSKRRCHSDQRMSFDAIAPHYRWLERLAAGPLLQRCRTQFIHEIRDARNIVLLGEGRGRFLIELLKVNPEARITCVDASARMLKLTRAELEKRRLLDRPRPSSSSSAVIFEHEDGGRGRSVGTTNLSANSVRFLHADILNGDWGGGSEHYAAVASHFFLDCFRPDQLGKICTTVAECTVPGAPWLISDFREPERGWQRVRARWILWFMYRFFRLTTRLPARRLSPPDEPLRRAGFELRNRQQSNHGLLHSDVWLKV